MESLYKVYRDDLLHLNDVQEKKSLHFLLPHHLIIGLHDHSFFFPTLSCDLEGPDQP